MKCDLGLFFLKLVYGITESISSLIRFKIKLSNSLRPTDSRDIDKQLCGMVASFPGLIKARTFDAYKLPADKISLKKRASHFLVFEPQWFRNSG